jgi:hypothetical protein
MQEKQSEFWRDSRGIVHVVRADIHNFCPKGHTLITRVPNVTEVPPFCNLCFKQVVQSSWAGEVKFCAFDSCSFTVCASCLECLREKSAKSESKVHPFIQLDAVSSLKVRKNAYVYPRFSCAS